MSTLALGCLLGLILTELDQAMTQVAPLADRFAPGADGIAPEPQSELLSLQVSDLDLELPAHVHVQADSRTPGAAHRLMITLPSTLEQPAGRVGRLRLTIAAHER
ncbi:MAG: hypothetical protein R3A44_39905 [Caldilineaceae bacterium]